MSSLLFIQPTDPGIDWFQRMPLLYNPLTLDETQQPQRPRFLPAVRRDAWCPHKLQLIFGCLNGPSHLICQLGDASWNILLERGNWNLTLLHPLQQTHACCEFVLLLWVSIQNSKKKIHQPELDWIYWKGKILDLLFTVTFLRWRHIGPHHSSRCDRSMFHSFTQPWYPLPPSKATPTPHDTIRAYYFGWSKFCCCQK